MTGKRAGQKRVGLEAGGGSRKVSRGRRKRDKIRTLASAAASQLIGMVAVFFFVLFVGLKRSGLSM